jgi:hypothetical protein
MAIVNGLQLRREDAESLSPEERRAMLDALHARQRPIIEAISFLEGTCHHTVKALTETPKEYYKKDRWRSDGANCEGCGLDMGWYCPCSPTHVCNYEQEDGSYDSDHCIHCHMPDERK